jgi:hypothetical protein
VKRIPGIADVYTRSQLATMSSPQSAIARTVLATFHPDRGPDLYVVQKPYWYLYKDRVRHAAMHASPYPYDTHVPVLLFGPGVAAGRHSRRVTPGDLAPTICHLLGITAPSSSEGQVLTEAIRTAQ